MGRRLVSLTGDNVTDLPATCRSCVFWEAGHRRPDTTGKCDWLSAVLLDWGSCGRLLYVDGQLAAFAVYAPPRYVALGASPAAGGAGEDAVLLMTARVMPQFASTGLGRVLIQAVAKDLMRRKDVRAIEVIGDAQGHEHFCVVPARFLTAVGFKTVQPHPRYPRLRLDLRSVVTWREEMEVALERWLGAIRPEKSTGPVLNPRDNKNGYG